MPNPKISIYTRVNAYKYHLPALTNMQIKSLLKTGQIELSIISIRWFHKKHFTEFEMIFKRHLNGLDYPSLMLEFNCSRKHIVKALNEVRMALITDINKDIESGKLKIFWKPITKKLNNKSILKDWKKHKYNLVNNIKNSKHD